MSEQPVDEGFERAVAALIAAGVPDADARKQLAGIQLHQGKIRSDLEALKNAKEGETVKTHDGKFWRVRFVNGEAMLEPDTRTGKQRRLEDKPKKKRFR